MQTTPRGGSPGLRIDLRCGMRTMLQDLWNNRLIRRTVPVRRPRKSVADRCEPLENKNLLGELFPSAIGQLSSDLQPAVTGVEEASIALSSTGDPRRDTSLSAESESESESESEETGARDGASLLTAFSASGVDGQFISDDQTGDGQVRLETTGLATRSAPESAQAASKKELRKQLKSDLKADRAARKAERKAERAQRKADRNNSSPDDPVIIPDDPGSNGGGGNDPGVPGGSGGDGSTPPPPVIPTDPTGGGTGPGTTPTTPGTGPILPAFPGDPQLSAVDVQQLLDRASAATPSQDAIIVVVDRQGEILGVRTEAAVSTADLDTLVFSIDGAVAKARTAAFFSNNQAALTSRTVRFISQSTITEREVDSNPSIADMSSTVAGPGFVAPIGLGGHFPPGVAYTPPVDLFAIEHSNRDTIDQFPGGEGRFHADYVSAEQQINAPGSYGVQSGLLPDAQPRGIATLPGGVPLYRDTDGNGVGDMLIGGIGVFFPGPDGYASFEQGFVHGDGRTATQRTNASRVLEAEFIALAAIGSSRGAGVVAGALDGVAPLPYVDLPFGRIDLVGITLEGVGPTAGIEGVKQLLKFGTGLGSGTVNGTDQMVTPVDTFQAGEAVPTGWLVAPKGSGSLTAADVQTIIEQGIAEAMRVRSAIRLPLGQRSRMVFAVTDLDGEVLGLFRMDDSTYFSLDVAVAKARNMAYYADPTALDPDDQVLSRNDVAFTNRTFRFLAEPRYPSGVEGSRPGPFSILNESSINPLNGENLGAPAPASDFDTVLGYDAFNIGTNFRDVTSPAEHQNGVVFFPGSSAIYKDGVLVGGLGVSGDGVDQDDVVTTAAIRGFEPPSNLKADRYYLRDVRLPYSKFLRNPYG